MEKETAISHNEARENREQNISKETWKLKMKCSKY